jgi:hypothetical protein
LSSKLSPKAQISAALAVASLEPCFLCWQPSSVAAIFEPNEGFYRDWLGYVPEDTKKLVFYALCEDCFRHDDVRGFVEDEILRRARQGYAVVPS